MVVVQPLPAEHRAGAGSEQSRSLTQEPNRSQAGEDEHGHQDGDADALPGVLCPRGFVSRAGFCNTERGAWQCHPHPAAPMAPAAPRALPSPFSRSEAGSWKVEGKKAGGELKEPAKCCWCMVGSVAAWPARPVVAATLSSKLTVPRRAAQRDADCCAGRAQSLPCVQQG